MKKNIQIFSLLLMAILCTNCMEEMDLSTDQKLDLNVINIYVGAEQCVFLDLRKKTLIFSSNFEKDNLNIENILNSAEIFSVGRFQPEFSYSYEALNYNDPKFECSHFEQEFDKFSQLLESGFENNSHLKNANSVIKFHIKSINTVGQ